MATWHDQDMYELREALSDQDMEESAAMKVGAILSSKTIAYTAEVVTDMGNNIIRATHEVVRETQKIEHRIGRLNRTLEAMVKSANRVFGAALAFSIIMALLALAIAFSTLVQAGIITLG